MPKKWDLSSKKPVLFNDDSADLRHALEALAEEMNSFKNLPEELSYYDCHGPMVVEDICRSSMKFKENQIDQLRGRLKMACEVARVAVSFTENKAAIKSNNEVIRKSDAQSSKEKNTCLCVLDKLTRENTASAMKLEVLQTIIELGYNKLQKLYGSPPETELDFASKLNQIIFACGHFYASYYNEIRRSEKQKQLNSQLVDTINLKDDQLKLLKEELHRIRKQNMAAKEGGKKCYANCKRNVNRDPLDSEIKSEDKACSYKNLDSVSIEKELEIIKLDSQTDLIKSLIEDHENMASTLKAITSELNKTCKCY